MKQLDPNVFIKAAELVSKPRSSYLGYDYRGCCRAIHMASGGYSEDYTRFFIDLFWEDAFKINPHSYWFGDLDKSNSELRTTAMLLCAELVRDE